MTLARHHYLGCIVGMERVVEDRADRWLASGFLYKVICGWEQGKWRVYLVTNRHALEGLSKVCFRRYPLPYGRPEKYEVCLVRTDGTAIWTPHPRGFDIGVIAIDFNNLSGLAGEFFLSDGEILTADAAPPPEASEGDRSYTLGFPTGRGAGSTVDVRVGPIATIGDLLKQVSHSLLVDILAFPGTSGGPVILQTEIGPTDSTMCSGGGHLIGIVSRSLKYAAIAGREQAERNRTKPDEAWLAEALPMNLVTDTIQTDLERCAHWHDTTS